MPLIALALSLALPQQDACRKLMGDFARNEDAFSFDDMIDDGLIEAGRQYERGTGDGSKLAWAKQKQRDDAREHLETGDRLVALMTGQRCPLPDHITSPFTFKVDRERCDAARGGTNEPEACSYVERAIDQWLPKMPATKPTSNRRKGVRTKR